MTPSAFAAYLSALAEKARSEADVIGLVAFGSTADTARVDQWSDHDFAWITEPGAENRYRNDLSWLPPADGIAFSAVAGHGGVTVVFQDGHVLEFGIASVEDFAGWAGDRAEVVVGDSNLRRAVDAVLARGTAATTIDLGSEMRLALAKLLIGVGRSRRGETLSAAGLIRDEAVTHLLRAIRERIAAPAELDPRRRLETVAPRLATRLEAACRLAPEDAARELLAIAEGELGEELPAAAAAAIRRRLGWI
ncbi:MAG: hypothetical protein JWP32_1652 [Schumannella sp.]|nr:hypothetical protein [Schumannella sp.]